MNKCGSSAEQKSFLSVHDVTENNSSDTSSLAWDNQRSLLDMLHVPFQWPWITGQQVEIHTNSGWCMLTYSLNTPRANKQLSHYFVVSTLLLFIWNITLKKPAHTWHKITLHCIFSYHFKIFSRQNYIFIYVKHFNPNSTFVDSCSSFD